MQQVQVFLDRTCNGARKLLIVTGIACISVMTIIMWAQVIMRYVFGIGLPWAEEVSKYLMVWSAMLGSAVVYLEKGHISVDFIVHRLDKKHRHLVTIIHILLAMGLFIVITVYGFSQAIFGLDFKSPATGISRFWPYLSIFAGGLFMLLFSVKLLIDKLLSNQND